MKKYLLYLRLFGIPLVLAFLFTLIDAFSFTGDFWLLIVCVLALWAWVFTMVVKVVLALQSDLWLRSLSLVLILIFVWPFVLAILQSKDYIHLAFFYPAYRAQFGKTSERQSFPWEMTGFAGIGETDSTLIYDPSDKVKDEIINRTPLPNKGIEELTPLVGHFYKKTTHY